MPTLPPFAVIECDRPNRPLRFWFAEFLLDNRTIISVSSGQVDKPRQIALWNAETGRTIKATDAIPYSPETEAWISPDRLTLAVSHQQTVLVETATLKIRP